MVTSTTVRVTEADLSILRTVFLPSGYRGVYRKGRGSSLWQARPYSSGGSYKTKGESDRKGRLGPRVLAGTFRSPREAAMAVVRWWKERFGEEWVSVYRRRTWNPWFARQVDGGWELVVRVRGAETVVPPPGGGVFASRDLAALYFRTWAVSTYGGAAWLALRAG